MTNDMVKRAIQRASEENKRKEMERKGRLLTPLEMSRAIVNGDEKAASAVKYSTALSTPEKTVEISRGMLEDAGWDELEAALEGHEGADSLQNFLARSERHNLALASLKQVLGLKPGTTTRIKKRDWDLIQDFTRVFHGKLAEMEKEAREKVKAMKHVTVSIPGEHGPLFLDATTMKLLEASVNRGRHLLLIGEPGSGKTDVARALPGVTGRALFHMEVSGLSDVSQLEAERYLEVVDGASVTVSKPTALILALEAAEAGERVVLVIDEVARVVDPAILNPLLLLMSHGEYHAVVGKRTYRVTPDNFVVICTANIEPGRNFSGNNRRGMDDAFVDRVRIVRIERAPATVVPEIIKARVPMDGLSEKVKDNMLRALGEVYKMATTPEQRRIITTRSIMGIADAWVSLDPVLYSLSEVMMLELSHRTADQATLSGLVSALESRGL